MVCFHPPLRGITIVKQQCTLATSAKGAAARWTVKLLVFFLNTRVMFLTRVI